MKTRALSVLFALTALVSLGRGAGFTEPPVTFYGKITQNDGGNQLLITSGELAWTIQPAGGAAFVITTPLSALSGDYSYRLQIPVEKVPGGFTLSPATIPAGNLIASYNRSQVTLDGAPLTIVSSSPAFIFAENQRGKTERVDLSFTGPFLDSDNDGVPDWWEDQYIYDRFDPSDALIDDDGDGQTTLQEYLAGNDPRNATSSLRITNVIKPTGLEITWTSVPGKKYRVDTASTLTGTYTPLSGIITAGEGEFTKNFTHAFPPGERRRFYKVFLVP